MLPSRGNTGLEKMYIKHHFLSRLFDILSYTFNGLCVIPFKSQWVVCVLVSVAILAVFAEEKKSLKIPQSEKVLPVVIN